MVAEDGVGAAVVAVQSIARAQPEVAARVLTDSHDGELGDSFVKLLAVVEGVLRVFGPQAEGR